MKQFIVMTLALVAVFQLFMVSAYGQESFRSTYYEQRRTLFENLPDDKREIIFLGNSITDGGEWTELFNNKRIKNRGISGDTTEGVLFRLNEVTGSKPEKVFLLIGVNDLARGVSREQVFDNICRIAGEIEIRSPKTAVYLQSILPVNPEFEKFAGHCSKTAEIVWINKKLKDFCDQSNFHYIDLFSAFKNKDNDYMNPLFTNDGLHLTGNGYLNWTRIIGPFLEAKN